MHTVKELQDLLSLSPATCSKFEFLTFEIASHLTTPRKIRFVLQKIVETEEAAEKERAMLKMINDAKAANHAYGNKQEREKLLSSHTEMLQFCYEWLDQFTKDDLKFHLSNMVHAEPEYWVTKIGTEAAVDILTVGRMSAETVKKLIMFEREEFIKAVMFATELARKIQQNTADAEALMNGDQE